MVCVTTTRVIKPVTYSFALPNYVSGSHKVLMDRFRDRGSPKEGHALKTRAADSWRGRRVNAAIAFTGLLATHSSVASLSGV